MRSARNPEQWFLIDFDDASTVPMHAVTHMNRGTHSPHVFKDGHLGEVDIWGVGKLIIQSADEVLGVSAGMKELGEKLLSDEQLTAAEVIILINRFADMLFILLSFD